MPDIILYMLLGIVSGALSIFLFIFRVLGAGDIKLLMVTGVFIGHRNLILCFPLILLYAGIFAFITLIFTRIKNEKKIKPCIPMAPVILLGVMSEAIYVMGC